MDKKEIAILGGIALIGGVLGATYYASQPHIKIKSTSQGSSSVASTSVISVVDVKLVVSSTNIVQGTPITLTASVVDVIHSGSGGQREAKDLSGVIVKFSGLGTPFYATTSAFSTANRTVNIKTPGTYNITATYKNVSSTLTVNVSKDMNLNTLTLVSSSGTGLLVDKPAIFRVKALNSYNTPLGHIKASIYIDGVASTTLVTNANGNASFELAFGLASTYVMYAKNSATGIESTSLSLAVSDDYNIELIASTTKSYADGNTTLQQQVGGNVYWIAKVTVLNSGHPAGGVEVLYQLAGSNTEQGTVVKTGTTGIAIVHIAYNHATTQILQATAIQTNSKGIRLFPKNVATTNMSQVSDYATVNIVNNYQANLKASASSVTQNSNVTFTLTAKNGFLPLSGKFTIDVNGVSTGTGTFTNGSGTFTLTMTNTGTENISVKTNIPTGNGQYLTASATVDVTVAPKTYTCYFCNCKTEIIAGQSMSLCFMTTSITSTSPCPNNNTGGYSSVSECCSANPCG